MSESNIAFLSVTDLLMKTLENAAKDLVRRCITECASRHNFDASEEIRFLGVENLSLIRKQMVRKSGPRSEKKPKERKPKKKDRVIPLPFDEERVDGSCCQGLAYNRGLFTQCQKKVDDSQEFCSNCLEQCSTNSSGLPDCGTVEQRLSCGLYDFKDSKGRSPILYSKILEKMKISSEEVSDLKLIVNPIHFQVPEEKKKTSGRPKKAKGAIESENVTDLFAKLTAEEEEPMFQEEEEKPKKSKSKGKLTEEEKEAKKAQFEEERAIKKAEKEAKLAEEKAEREAKKAQEKTEREAKLALEKAEREAKKAQEKAEREAKKSTEKTSKAKKGKEEAPKEVAVEPPKEVAVEVEAPKAAVVEEAPKKLSVIKKTIKGKTYLWSKSTNVLYDCSTRDEVGIYDPATDTINELPEEEDEEEEVEEYDE